MMGRAAVKADHLREVTITGTLGMHIRQDNYVEFARRERHQEESSISCGASVRASYNLIIGLKQAHA